MLRLLTLIVRRSDLAEIRRRVSQLTTSVRALERDLHMLEKARR